MKVRTLLELLHKMGGAPVRTEGSHQIWSLPGGGHVPVVVNHLNADVSRRVLASVRRALRQVGLQLPRTTGKASRP